jgi:para-aminobenzoate synthetase component I
MLNWLRPFSIFCYLDNQQYQISPHQTDCLVAAGVHSFVEGTDIKQADDFIRQNQWVFGHMSYELKDSIHHLTQEKENKIGFPTFYFFSPVVVLEIKQNELLIYAESPAATFEKILATPITVSPNLALTINPAPELNREEYIKKIEALKAHILRGDCYEINFCQEFFASEVSIDPFACFENLMQVSPNPFSAFYRLHEKYLLCASPERFLAKQGSKVFSQPMKGTIKRAPSSKEADEALKQELINSLKDQSENVMVVDLVRNDLAKICNEGSVKVDELFGIYSFPQVHQMISTVSGELKENISFSEIMEATFPMGSMTGAPKHRVMQLIDQYEPTARGIFSGAVGYFNPQGDFDFNVVIRSIMYNAEKQFLSYQVGSGITFYSEAEKEWEECMLKAEAIKKVLTSRPALPA